MALGFVIGAIAIVIAAAVAAGMKAGFMPGGHGMPPTKVMAPVILLFVALYLVALIFISTFIGTMTFNLAVNSSRFGDNFSLESELSPWAMTWIIASNLVVTILTLGLMYPWAGVRQTRYTVEHIAITGPDDMDGFVSAAASQRGAIGEEVAGFFDIDFGL